MHMGVLGAPGHLQCAMQALSGRQVMCNVPLGCHVGILGASRCLQGALTRLRGCSRGTWSSTVCPQVISNMPLGHRMGVLGAPSHLQCALRTPCGRSRAAYSSAVCPRGPSSGRHATVLWVPGRLQCALHATCGCSCGAWSSTVRPQGAMWALTGRQVIYNVPSRHHMGALGAPGHLRCHASVLKALGHLQRALLAPCERSRSAWSPTVRPLGTMRGPDKLSNRAKWRYPRQPQWPHGPWCDFCP